MTDLLLDAARKASTAAGRMAVRIVGYGMKCKYRFGINQMILID